MSRYHRRDNRFDRLLDELGVPRDQFDFSSATFDMSPRRWLEERLRALGWERKLKAATPCERECCR